MKERQAGTERVNDAGEQININLLITPPWPRLDRTSALKKKLALY